MCALRRQILKACRFSGLFETNVDAELKRLGVGHRGVRGDVDVGEDGRLNLNDPATKFLPELKDLKVWIGGTVDPRLRTNASRYRLSKLRSMHRRPRIIRACWHQAELC